MKWHDEVEWYLHVFSLCIRKGGFWIEGLSTLSSMQSVHFACKPCEGWSKYSNFTLVIVQIKDYFKSYGFYNIPWFIFWETMYKYRSCVAPIPSEF